MPTNRKILSAVVSWAVVIVGLILVVYELNKLIRHGESFSSNFITGLTLVYEGLRIASGESPQRTS